MEMPVQFKKENFRFIKLKRYGKTPIEKDWVNTNNYAYSDILSWEGNRGVITGVGGLYILDFDSLWAFNQVKDYLPPTLTILSAGRKLPHLYYIDNKNEPASTKFFLKNGKTALDVLGKGKQAVIPFSQVKNELYIPGIEDIPEFSVYNIQEDLPIARVSQGTILCVLRDIFEGGLRHLETKKVPYNENKGHYKRNDRVQDIKDKVSISKFFRYIGVSKNGRLWDTPFGHSVNKKCVDVDDRKGVFYDFNMGFGGDLITAAKRYWNCGFITALDKLEEEFK